MRYRLRTLVITLAVLPPVLAGLWCARESIAISIVFTTIAGLLVSPLVAAGVFLDRRLQAYHRERLQAEAKEEPATLHRP